MTPIDYCNGTVTAKFDGTHNRFSVDSTLAGGSTDPTSGSYVMNIGSGNCTIVNGIPGTPIDDADRAMNQYTTTPLDARSYDRNGNLTGILGNKAAGNALAISCLYDYRNRLVEYRDNISGRRTT